MYESVSGSDNDARGSHAGGDDVAPLAQRVVALLAGRRGGLVTDIDGTISPIVARPEEAIVLPAAREALRGLAELLSVTAVVTGRSASDAVNMLGIDGLTYIGNHGLEVWSGDGPQLVAEARPWVPRVAAVLDEVARRLNTPIQDAEHESPSDKGDSLVDPASRDPLGIIIENKGATASLHYRLAPDTALARREILEILARCAVTSGLRVEEGRMVVNLLPPLTVSKGSAVTRLVREHSLESIVYLGDDITDTHAFRALRMLRQSDAVGTLGIGVGGEDTPPSVLQLADVMVPSVEAVATLLCEVLEGLRAGAETSARMKTKALRMGVRDHG